MPGEAGGDGAGAEDQDGAQGRLDHLGVVEDDVDALPPQLLASGQRVAPDDRQDVHGGQRHQAAAAEGVPAGQPVGTDLPLQDRYPGHHQQQDRGRVPGQQAGDPARARQPARRAGDRPGVAPPEGQDPQRAEGERGYHDRRHGGDREAARRAVRRAARVPTGRGRVRWCDGCHRGLLPTSDGPVPPRRPTLPPELLSSL